MSFDGIGMCVCVSGLVNPIVSYSCAYLSQFYSVFLSRSPSLPLSLSLALSLTRPTKYINISHFDGVACTK